MVPIRVPCLQERLEDIPLLVEDLMDDMKAKGLKKKSFSESAYRELMDHSWPGNVRELRNFVERLVIMCQEEVISDLHVRMFLTPPAPGKMPAFNTTILTPYQANDFKEAKRRFEREFLHQKLIENEGNISKTAEHIGLERSHLHKKLKSLNIIS